MPFNKISGLSNLPAAPLPMSIPAGATFMLPVGQGVVGTFGAISAPQLAAGNPLSGQYAIQLGQYTTLQVFDPTLQYWRDINVAPMGIVTCTSDGANFRIANTTGCPVGGLITAAGSAGTNGFYGYNNQGAQVTIQGGVLTPGNTVFTIAPSAGGSQWNAIVGGAINTTIAFAAGTGYQNLNGFFVSGAPSVTTGPGSGYTRPPLIQFSPPPNQGQQPCILPTAICTISGGAINAVTVINQGAGLLGLPGITVIPQPGDTTGGGAVLGWTSGNGTQVGSGTVLAMWPMFYGTALAAAPTFTFAGTSNPAPSVTSIMNWTITSITNSTPGVGYTAAYAVVQGGMVAGSAANTNPMLDKGLSIPIYPPLSVVAGTGVTTLAGPFGGVNFQAAPTIALGTQLAAGTVTTVAVQTPVMGGASDTVLFMSL